MKTIKRHATRGPRGLVSKTVKTLIKKGDLSDKEICAYIKSMWPEANTSVKAVQYYRYQMRNDGLIPAAKINKRKDRTILRWELIPGPDAVCTEMQLEGQYDGKHLIKRCREVLIALTRCSKDYAYEKLYSVPSCALFLHELGWECIEFQMTVKINEYVEED